MGTSDPQADLEGTSETIEHPLENEWGSPEMGDDLSKLP